MSYTIRPMVPFSPAERRRLHRWLDNLGTKSVDAARRISFDNETFLVQADADTSHDVAIVAMLEIGRPFHYTLAPAPRRQHLAAVDSVDGPRAPVGLSA